MPVSEKTIIDPDSPTPGIPIRKSTMAAIAGLVAAGGLVISFLMSGNSEQEASKPTAENVKVARQDPGTRRTIDEEQRAAQDALDREERRRALEEGRPVKSLRAENPSQAEGAARQQTAAASSPLPSGVRRENQDAAIYEGAFRKGILAAKPSEVPGPERGSGAPGKQGALPRDLEFDAQARNSKSLAFDDDAGQPDRPGAGATGAAFGQGASSGNLLATGASSAGRDRAVGVGPLPAAPSAGINNLPGAMTLAGPAAPRAPGQPGGSVQAANDAAWVQSYGAEQRTNEPLRSYVTGSRFTLHQGKVIPSVLGRDINTDLPGEVTAYTTIDVYDSLGNGYLLIPKGSVLVGRFNSDVKVGQSRVMFAFQRLIMPDGRSFDLPGAEAYDMGGASGIEGDVDNHFWKMFSSSFMVAWMSDRLIQQPANVTVIGGGGTTTTPAGQVLIDVSRTILDRNKNIRPTVTVEKGERINIEVKRDMEFPGPYIRRASR